MANGRELERVPVRRLYKSQSTSAGVECADAPRFQDTEVLQFVSSPTAAANHAHFGTTRPFSAPPRSAPARMRARVAWSRAVGQQADPPSSLATTGAAGLDRPLSAPCRATTGAGRRKPGAREDPGPLVPGQPIPVVYTPGHPADATLAAPAARSHSLRDYQLMAQACQRAGRTHLEALACFQQGELLARTPATLAPAVMQFKRFLDLSRRLHDPLGEAKALNCLGICYQRMGGQENLQHALEYHKQHADLADPGGRFVAWTNLGLVEGERGFIERAVEHHRQALRCAVDAGDPQAEAVALANLGQLGASHGDASAARGCLERQLALEQTLGDEGASLQAAERLGVLALRQGDWTRAHALLAQALRLATEQRQQQKANDLRCLLGVSSANDRLEEHFRAVAKNMRVRPDKWPRNDGSAR